MKKWIINIHILILLISYIMWKWYSDGLNKQLPSDDTTLIECIDGSKAKFRIRNEIIVIHFVSIMVSTKTESEASKYTCDALKNASDIRLEYEGENDAWVFIDDDLLQAQLLENGLVKISDPRASYKYIEILLPEQDNAKQQKKGIWKNEK